MGEAFFDPPSSRPDLSGADVHLEHFFSFENFINVLLQNANIAILAVGLTLVILLGEIDLSWGGWRPWAVCGAWMMVYGGLGVFPLSSCPPGRPLCVDW